MRKIKPVSYTAKIKSPTGAGAVTVTVTKLPNEVAVRGASLWVVTDGEKYYMGQSIADIEGKIVEFASSSVRLEDAMVYASEGGASMRATHLNRSRVYGPEWVTKEIGPLGDGTAKTERLSWSVPGFAAGLVEMSSSVATDDEEGEP